MGHAKPLSIRAVIFREHDRLVVQGIDYDICASAEPLSRIMPLFMRRVAGNMAVNAEMGRTGLEGFKPAPERFLAMFEQAEVES